MEFFGIRGPVQVIACITADKSYRHRLNISADFKCLTWHGHCADVGFVQFRESQPFTVGGRGPLGSIFAFGEYFFVFPIQVVRAEGFVQGSKKVAASGDVDALTIFLLSSYCRGQRGKARVFAIFNDKF